MIVSADHGNSDDMYARDKKGKLKIKKNGKPEAKTSHSLNPVPCILFDPEGKDGYEPQLREGLGISSLAATVIELLGYLPPEDYDPSVIELKRKG
jgi:2,3-bisphosphoglycerate-independent phosphoglycerate mutase